MQFLLFVSDEKSEIREISAFARKKYFPNEISVCDAHMAQNSQKTRILGH